MVSRHQQPCISFLNLFQLLNIPLKLTFELSSVRNSSPKSRPINYFINYSIKITFKRKRNVWLKADTSFRSEFNKQVTNVVKKRQENFTLYRNNTSILMEINKLPSNDRKEEVLNLKLSTPDLAHSIYQIRHHQLTDANASSNLSNFFEQSKKTDLIDAEIKQRVKTAGNRESHNNKFYSMTRRFIHETSPFQVETKKERNLLEAQKMFREKTMIEENKIITKKDTRFYNLINSLENVKLNE